MIRSRETALVAQVPSHAMAAALEAVQAMEEPYRSTIVYRFYEDLQPREIGHSPLGLK